MSQRTNSLRRFIRRRDSVIRRSRCALPLRSHLRNCSFANYMAVVLLLLLALTTRPMFAQEKSPEPAKQIWKSNLFVPPDDRQTPSTSATPVTQTPSTTPTPLTPSATQVTPTPSAIPAGRSITISDAVTIFLQQNLQLIAARYDIDTAEAEKLTAQLRPNPQLSVSTSGVPLSFTGPFIKEQTFDYGISQTFELGGKRSKRIAAADANADLARAVSSGRVAGDQRPEEEVLHGAARRIIAQACAGESEDVRRNA